MEREAQNSRWFRNNIPALVNQSNSAIGDNRVSTERAAARGVQNLARIDQLADVEPVPVQMDITRSNPTFVLGNGNNVSVLNVAPGNANNTKRKRATSAPTAPAVQQPAPPVVVPPALPQAVEAQVPPVPTGQFFSFFLKKTFP